MRSRMSTAITAALVLGVLQATAPAASEEPTVWLHVEVNEAEDSNAKVKITLPLSLVEVAIESADTAQILRDLRTDKGMDLAKLWEQLKSAELDEFVTIDSTDAKVKVFKEPGVFRVTASEVDGDETKLEVRIPFSVMDYLFNEDHKGFRLSEMVSGLRAELPLVLVEARDPRGERVKVWLAEN